MPGFRLTICSLISIFLVSFLLSIPLPSEAKPTKGVTKQHASGKTDKKTKRRSETKENKHPREKHKDGRKKHREKKGDDSDPTLKPVAPVQPGPEPKEYPLDKPIE